MKIQLDANQQSQVANTLQLNTSVIELDEKNLMEVQGGILPGGCVIQPPKLPIYTTMAIGEEGGGIATTLALGEEGDGIKILI